MSCYGYRNTAKFLNVTGEEVGLFGSSAYASDAQPRGENILGVINMDMPGWEGDGNPDPEDLDLNYNSSSQWLALQFAENKSDRQAADAVRGRIDWKYLLGLELADPGFDYTLLHTRNQNSSGPAESQ